ncbi:MULTISPECIES: hypothetical protein [Dyella]|uniref:Tetratricopeptide repeat protein n=2 Tax=Dyella TaxID=231454 RepID=A0A4R0YY23_9GAMM|nr:MULTISPECIES: hypothetical protein [Dyella]TBR40137.1 hypothetical protein EYV96_08195 [Dyella terrae]TCI12279.1 hypothetical protein EZM97_02675 [Dyella soli]
MMRKPLPNANRWLLLIGLLLTIVIYAPGLSGAYLFDDFPNIVDNKGVQPSDASLGSLVRAALSSPSSEFKRPLASLSFAINFLISGLNPFWMKLTNLGLHLINGCLAYFLAGSILRSIRASRGPHIQTTTTSEADRLTAAWIAFAWLVLPINLTSVLYVVQRMEALAATFIFLGLALYLQGRERMLSMRKGGSFLCAASIVGCTSIGLLAKETAVMLPFYAFLTEWIVFRFRANSSRIDKTISTIFIATLGVPLILGLAWQAPALIQSSHWSNRDFTLSTRLLTEARVVVDYIAWTLAPAPGGLSFYHDDYPVSAGLLNPWTTLASIVFLAALALTCWKLRKRYPAASLGIAYFLGCHLLTGTVLPLELVYEHRNYFATFGLMLTIVPVLASSPKPEQHETASSRISLAPRHLLFGVLVAYWIALTSFTSYAWGSPLRLAIDLAARGPNSPRAQYELGRMYILLSQYNPKSPYTKAAYEPLEKSASLPGSTILPEQALIFMNARMGVPLQDRWWSSMYAKLKGKKPGVQDESSLESLTQCMIEKRCELPQERMTSVFLAALSHERPSARLLAIYSNYAWNVLGERDLAEGTIRDAIIRAPNEPAYRITHARMLIALGKTNEASHEIDYLAQMNVGGSLDHAISDLRNRSEAQSGPKTPGTASSSSAPNQDP